MIVSVIVSMASPLITGVASLSSTRCSASGVTPARSSAARTAVTAPSAFLGVPFTPVVRVSAVASRVTAPSADLCEARLRGGVADVDADDQLHPPIPQS